MPITKTYNKELINLIKLYINLNIIIKTITSTLN
jgi:hypothetical protein